MDASKLLFLLLLYGYLPKVSSVQMCDVMNDIRLEKERCENSTSGNVTSGCQGMWDIIACWPSASVGEVVTITCPTYFSYFSDEHKGNLSKTCTADGWTEMHPMDIAMNCGYNLNSTSDDGKFFWQVKIGYTIGHSVSLISLTTAIGILCLFRKLHCTRNYIHMHLFVSFILKAIAVFIKDVVLYDVGEVDNCSSGSQRACLMLTFVDLHLLDSLFLIKKYLYTVLLSPQMNFILFICIIRILRQKINCPDIGRNESNQYSRLAKSTLLLIPLFGINFIVFAFIPEQVKTELRLVFDLILGSFQGFVVAVLYCFLNGEVQGEIKRKWRRWHLQRYMGSDTKYQHPSIGSSNNFSTQITMLTRCSPKTRRASSSCHDDLSSI
ncbi:vasoactive intestinal polypeptide receptor 1b [Plectropomus leopardus]|uniref:vasoactive intestinal polypeptide receptor 1b n=1 Tax=Plectropomus leopardus TaxID=160734 RepID=UPI001C4CB242|nr:vasoactive intestinal polypeptide receptor 1b [Plectropomus leopardus]